MSYMPFRLASKSSATPSETAVTLQIISPEPSYTVTNLNTVVLASEITLSAITAKAGACLRWMRVL